MSRKEPEKIEIKVGGKYITRNGQKAKVNEIGEKYAIGAVFSAGLWWLSVWYPDGTSSKSHLTEFDIVDYDNG